MRRVIIESPYAGAEGGRSWYDADVLRNLRYLRACMRDCLLRRETPYASHHLYTAPGVLDDGDPLLRKLGIEAGLAWRPVADATVVYRDLGISDGMRWGIEHAEDLVMHESSHVIEYRELGADWDTVSA